MPSGDDNSNHGPLGRSAYWLSWMLGAAILASFMISSVFRTVGIVPGGLGTFEATSVWTLNMMGVAIPIGLAATLLFRGFSFWLPMLPGWWVSRRIAGWHRRGLDASRSPEGLLEL